MSKNITIEVTRSSLNDATAALVYNINTIESFMELHKETMSDSIRNAAENVIQDNQDLINTLNKLYHFSNSDNISLSLNSAQITRLFISMGDAFKYCEGEKQIKEYHTKALQKTITDYEKLLDRYESICGNIINAVSSKGEINNGKQ